MQYLQKQYSEDFRKKSVTKRVAVLFAFGIVMFKFSSWLRHYATSWKVAGLNPDEVDCFNLPNPSFQPHYGSGVESAFNRKEYQEYCWG